MEYILMENKLSTEDRNKLKKSQFGLPEERKFPLHDESHVKSAIRFFYKCPEKDKVRLALAIEKAAKKFNIEISKDSEISKYLENNTSYESFIIACEQFDLLNEKISNRIVLESAEKSGFLSKMKDLLMQGLLFISRTLSNFGNWLRQKFRSLISKFPKNKSKYLEVPKIFTTLPDILDLSDKVLSDIKSSLTIMMDAADQIQRNIDDPGMIMRISESHQQWKSNRYGFIKNSNIITSKTKLGISDKTVQGISRITISEFNSIKDKSEREIDEFLNYSRSFSSFAKRIDTIWTSVEKKHNKIFRDRDVREAFSTFGEESKTLISDSIVITNQTVSNIEKIITLGNAAVVRQVSINDDDVE